MQCADSLRLQACFDGELDALSTAEVERHCETCTNCRALLEDLQRMRTLLWLDARYATAPTALRDRITRALDQQSGGSTSSIKTSWRANLQSSPFWQGVISGMGGFAMAAALAFILLVAPSANPILNDLVGAHVRSLMPDHLIDVVSTDKHTVKPWFAGHTDVSPVVADFEQQGYRLVGGRADYLDRQRAAVVVYKHGSHVINVFSWSTDQRDTPKNTTRNGYHLAFWKTGNLMNCAVSDTAWDELTGLVRLLQGLGNHDTP